MALYELHNAMDNEAGDTIGLNTIREALAIEPPLNQEGYPSYIQDMVSMLRSAKEEGGLPKNIEDIVDRFLAPHNPQTANTQPVGNMNENNGYTSQGGRRKTRARKTIRKSKKSKKSRKQKRKSRH